MKKTSSEKTINTNWEPPRGISYQDAPGRNKPLGLRWRADGKRCSQFFETHEEREKAAKELAKKKERHGEAILSFDPKGWAEYLSAKELVRGMDLRVVAAQWLVKNDPEKKEGLPCSEAIERYVALRYGKDVTIGSDTWRHLRLHLEQRFADHFGEMPLGLITPDSIKKWLAGIRSKKTGNLINDLARRHHRKDVNTFFKRAMAEGWCDSNPCTLVTPPKIKSGPVKILSVADARKLLEANKDFPVVGRLAFEMFGGLRCSSVKRLRKEHVSLKDKGVIMPGELHKSGKSKLRQGQPDVLWAWVEHAGEAMWDASLTDWQYDHEKQRAFTRANVENTGNVLRHSFASYKIALDATMHNAAYLMQHTSTKTTGVYEGTAWKSDAEEYFNLTPKNL